MPNKATRPLILGILAVSLACGMAMVADSRERIAAEPHGAIVKVSHPDELVADPASSAIYLHSRADLPVTVTTGGLLDSAPSQPTFILLGSVPVERRHQMQRISF